MNTVGFGDDRRAVANFSAVSSGVGLKSTSTGRTASNAMGPPPKPGPWKNNPTPIQTPASIAAVLNPFSKGRISSTLDDGRNRGSGPSGNRTAAQTIFNDRPVRSTAHYHVPASQPAKRQKTTHGEDSKYFRGGGGAGTGSLNGKGKAAAAAFEPVVIPDSDEERGARLSKGKRKESTPDPLDCIDVPEPLTSKRKSAVAPIHDFERTSDDEQLGRLPPDGPSTIRLQQQQQSRGEIVDIDLVSDDDEIESASGFDQDDGLVRKVATPNGRQHIPQGAVRQKITMYELKDAPPPPPPPKPAKQAQPPTIDLLKQQTRKGQMKPRNPKQPTTTPILALENRPAHAEKADAVAIAPSGFKPASRGNKPETPQPLPLEGVSLGCHIMQGEIVPPTLWASVHHNRGYKLLISTARKSGKTIADFALPKDVHSLKYTDTGPSARSGEVVVVQLSSTNTAKFKHKAFEPGSKYAAGLITLKFITNHTDWDGSAYKEFIAILRSNIPKAEVLRGAAAESCWETAEIAAKHKAGEFERNAPRQTRSNASSASSSSASAGPSHDTSTSVPSKEIESVSAPPGRTNATERRLTRQTARAARKSTTPENMDELVLVYPPSGTGAVNITKGDLRRLDNGQYLNDTLIEFGLKLWLNNLREEQPELAEQIHVFNSFFYKKLNSKKEVQDAYPSVRKWTSKVDIFKKKYIIVPINENFHWYLSIVVNPAGMLHPEPPEMRSAPQTRKRKLEEDQSAAAADAVAERSLSETRSNTEASEPVPEIMAVDVDSEGDQEVETMLQNSCSITDVERKSPAPAGKPDVRSRSVTGEAIDLGKVELQYPTSEEPPDEPMDVDNVPEQERDKDSRPSDPANDKAEKSSRVDKPTPAEDPDATAKLPEIVGFGSTDDNESAGEGSTRNSAKSPGDVNAQVLTFDSLGGKHTSVKTKLWKYLQQEALDKKGHPIEMTRQPGYTRVITPMQKNYCDCGLFVVAFAEAFMKDPVKAMERIEAHKGDWYTGSMDDLREVFRAKTLALSEAWKKERAEKEGTKEDTVSDKPKPPEPQVIEDSDDDIIVGEIIPATKPANKGGRKPTTGRAARIR